MPEPIEELFVRLGLDGVDWLNELEKKMNEGVSVANDGGKALAGAIGKGLEEGLAEGIGATLIEFAEDFGLTLEQAAQSMEGLALASGRTKEELLAIAQAHIKEPIDNFAKALDAAEQELAQEGAISDATASSLANYTIAVANAAASNDDLAARVQRANQILGEHAGQQREAAEGAKNSSGFMKMLAGDIGKLATSALAGFTVVKMLGDLKQYLDQAAESAIRFSEVNFRLEVAVRAAQRAQGDSIGTIKEYKEFADGLTETYGILREQTYALVGSTIRLTSELGLTKNEIQELAKGAAIMSQVAGVDAQSALFRFTQFINTGYARGLALMGFQVDRATQAQVALALGITKPILQWTKEEQVLVRTALIQQQVNKYAEDAAAGQDVLAKRVERSNTKLADAAKIMGDLVAPAIVRVKEAWADFMLKVADGVRIVVTALALMDTAAVAFSDRLVARAKRVSELVAQGMSRDAALMQASDEEQDTFADAFRKRWDEVARHYGLTQASLGDAAQSSADGQAAAAAEAAAAVDKAENEITAALDEEVKKYQEAADDIEKDYSDKLADLDMDLARRREDAATQLGRDLADIDTQVARDKTDAIRESQRDELRLREDHQIALRELERRYLFELEDAVRERDARGVLMLQRKYNDERRKENEDFRLKQKRRKEDLSAELRDLEMQRRQKRADRIADFSLELEDIALQDARKRDDAKKEYLRQLDDLDTALERRIDDLIKEALAENELSAKSLEALTARLKGYLGPGGAHDQIYKYAISSAHNYATQVAAAIAGAKVTGSTGLHEQGVGGPGGYQTGGSFIATSPRMIQVGERPEEVNVRPLNQATGAPIAGFGGGSRERVKIDLALRLPEGFTAEVVDQALSETADVILSMTKAESAGYGGATRPGGRQ